MKKTYMTPAVEIVDVKMNTQLLAGSTIGMGSGSKDPSSGDARMDEVFDMFEDNFSE